MNKRAVVAFTGVKGSGKSTAYGYLKELFPQAQELALARHLKDVCIEVFSLESDSLDNPSKKEVRFDVPINFTEKNVRQILKGFDVDPDFDTQVRPHIGKLVWSPREVAQYVGTEVMRSVDPFVHCKIADAKIGDTGLFVITDVRFPNEYTYFLDKYGLDFSFYYVYNPIAEAALGKTFHKSESYFQEMAKNAVRIENTGDLPEFRANVAKTFEFLNA